MYKLFNSYDSEFLHSEFHARPVTATNRISFLPDMHILVTDDIEPKQEEFDFQAYF